MFYQLWDHFSDPGVVLGSFLGHFDRNPLKKNLKYSRFWLFFDFDFQRKNQILAIFDQKLAFLALSHGSIRVIRSNLPIIVGNR